MNLFNRFTRRFGYEIAPYRPQFPLNCVSLVPPGQPRGNVLLSFIAEPFLLREGETISNEHTHDLVSFLMAQTFLDLGYTVDVIDYRHGAFVPKKRYAFFVSARTNLERIGKRLNKDCVKIAYLETSHFLFNNHASYSRSLELQQRRGVTVASRRVVEHNRAIECADYAVIMGNDFTAGTYRYAGKPTFTLSGTTVEVYPWSGKKDFNACRKSFLWFGATGLVHKGLDLVLEAFSQMPDLYLNVCGPVENETHFKNAYRKELYETPNVNTIGWIDVSGEEFRKVTEDCVALVYPSCAEGKSGAALTCMQAGLIPVLSHESGIDVHEFGLILPECTVNEIKRTVRKLAERPAAELQRMARATWEHARKFHTRERFAEEYREIVLAIINDSQSRQSQRPQ